MRVSLFGSQPFSYYEIKPLILSYPEEQNKVHLLRLLQVRKKGGGQPPYLP